MSTLRVNEITNEAGDGPPGGAASFFTQTVDTTDWTGSEPSIATLTVAGIKATDRPIVSLDVSNETFEDGLMLLREWNLAYRVEASADNEIKVYAVEEPVFTLNLLIKVVR